MIDLESALLEVVARKHYSPVKPGRIAKNLKLDEEQSRELKRVVKRLIKSGKLVYFANHAVGLPAAKPASGAATKKPSKDTKQIAGIFRRAAGGYGFVRPSDTAPSVDRAHDIYIAQKNAADAASGDLVLVALMVSGQGRSDPKRRGRIVEVLERETHRFVGTYFERAGYGMVQIDGTVFNQPIRVGDAGAKNARIDDKIVVEMVRFPSQSHDGEAVIVDVLGQRGDPGVDTLSIIHEYGLPGDFKEATLDVARDEAEAFDESISDGRLDLTGTTVLTIDPVDARDFDDAISLERTAKGHWRLGVHIADVSYFVKEKTALDREAKDRATSVYLPDRVIPMLPEIISNNLASLQPDQVRYAKTVFIEFTSSGVRVGSDVHSTAIRSDRRFTYEEVDDYLAKPTRWTKIVTAEVHTLLGDMHTLAMILRKRRFERGSLELSMPEVKIDLDDEGRVAGAHVAQNTESHQIIEEFMLAANEAVADVLREAQFGFLRRVHGAPDPRKLKALTEFVRELGFDVESLESRFEVQRLLDDVRDQPQQHAVNYAVLRSMQKAVYSPISEGHYALASDCYCHFTSPIRRYPDLTIHRLLDRVIASRAPTQHANQLAVLGEHCSQREQRATAAERELTKVKLLNYMSERIGEELDAVVTGVQDFGLFAQGIEIPAEGLVHISSLQDDYYHYDKTTHSLTGRKRGNAFRLGDFVRVAVAHVDVDRRVLDFRLVRRLKDRPADPTSRSDAGARRKRSPQNRTSQQASKRGSTKRKATGTASKKGGARGKKRTNVRRKKLTKGAPRKNTKSGAAPKKKTKTRDAARKKTRSRRKPGQ